MTTVYIVYEGTSEASEYHEHLEIGQEEMVKIFDCKEKAIEFMCNYSCERIEGLREDIFVRPINPYQVRENLNVYYAVYDVMQGGWFLKYKSHNVE